MKVPQQQDAHVQSALEYGALYRVRLHTCGAASWPVTSRPFVCPTCMTIVYSGGGVQQTVTRHNLLALLERNGHGK